MKPVITIPGFDIIANNRNSAIRRRCWCVAVLSCLLLAIIHGAVLIRRYQTYQTRVQLHVSNSQSLRIPDLTVCPADRFDLHKLTQLWTQRFGHSNSSPAIDPTEQYYQLADAMDVHTLWQQIAYSSPVDMIPMCFIGRGQVCHQVGTFKNQWTPFGTCFTYSSDQEIRGGHFNGLYFRLLVTHALHINNSESGWKLTFHDPNTSPVLLITRQYSELSIRFVRFENGSTAVKSQFVNLKLMPKEYVRVNHPDLPCRKGNYSETLCEIHCFERALISMTQCKLPYMTTDEVPFCSGSERVKMAEELAVQLANGPRSQINCQCPTPCTKVVYKHHSDSMTDVIPFGRVKVFYDTTMFVSVKQDFVYSPVGLLCDAGSVMGLLLGASLLSICEIFDLVVCLLLHCCRNRNRKFK